MFRHRDSPGGCVVGSILISKFSRSPTQTGKLEVRLLLSSLKHAKCLNSPLQTHVYVHIHIGPVKELKGQFTP